MKQKLMMLLAVLLTGGMLVACGPGDETADDPGAGVVDEPLTGDADTDATFGDDATTLGDDTTALDEPAAEGDTAVETDATTIEMDVDGETATTEDAAADDTAADVDMDVDETTEAQAGTEGEAEGDVAGGGAAAPAEGEAMVVTFSQGAEGVAVDNVEGAQDAQSIASMDEPNPDLTLSTGQRYEFAYDGEGDLVFYNDNDEEVFSTAGTDSEFANDSEVNAQMEDGRVSFTMTEDLAQELARYTAGPDDHGGAISVN